MAKSIEEVFEASPERTLEAFKLAVAQLGYRLLNFDESAKLLAFNTGRSMKSFAGQDLQVTVVPSDGGSTAILGGSIARRGGLSGSQQLAWGEKGALIKKTVEKARAVLSSIPEMPRSDSSAMGPPPDRLSALAKADELHKSGVLTDKEFESEKQRILDS